MNVGKFHSMVVLCIAASLLLSSCALPGAAPAATNTPAPTNTPKATSTSTPKPTVTPKPTATPNLAATQQVVDFAAKVAKYVTAGYLTTANGTYIHLSDVTYTWNVMNSYQGWEADIAPTDFVLNSDVTWDSASAAADSSGCGFIFRGQPNGDDYMVYVSLKGYVEANYFLAKKSQYAWSMGRGNFGIPAQHGTATLTLIVEAKTFRVLINDKLVKVYTGFDGDLADGSLAYTVLSGTNKSYGTRCNFKNTELWTVVHE